MAVAEKKKIKKTTITLDADVAKKIRIGAVNAEQNIDVYVRGLIEKFEENGWMNK